VPAWIERLLPQAKLISQNHLLTAGGSCLAIKCEILKGRVQVHLWNARYSGGGIPMDWTLIAILIVAVIGHVVVAGFGG